MWQADRQNVTSVQASQWGNQNLCGTECNALWESFYNHLDHPLDSGLAHSAKSRCWTQAWIRKF